MSNHAAHSDGPWELVSHTFYGHGGEEWGHTQIVTPDGEHNAVVYSTGPESMHRDRQRANAMVLKASWEMLAALKALTSVNFPTDAWKQATAAIAKAEAAWNDA